VGLAIYKSSQGRYIRSMTAVGLGLVDLMFSYYVWKLLSSHVGEVSYKEYLVYAIPAVAFVVLAILTFVYLNRPSVVDFLIATESEMKKVSWSSRSELIGSTTVVIGTVFLLAILLWLSDTIVIMLYTQALKLW